MDTDRAKAKAFGIRMSWVGSARKKRIARRSLLLKERKQLSGVKGSIDPGKPETEFEVHATLYVHLRRLLEPYGWTVRGDVSGSEGSPDLSIFDGDKRLVALVEVKRVDGPRMGPSQRAKYETYGVPLLEAIGMEGARRAYRKLLDMVSAHRAV